jgi:hypothetical protein
MSQNLNPQVPRIDQVEAARPLEGTGEETVSGKPFSSYMEEAPTSGTQNSNVSPMDLARPATSPSAPPTVESVTTQMQAASSSLGDLQNKLNTPNLKLKPSQKYLLRNKLQEAHSQIRQVAEKAGVDVGPPPSPLTRNNPLGKFLSMLTDGEAKLNSAQQTIASFKGQLQPADLLLMQYKLTRAQQEIEYSSVLLSKAVDDIKTIFNIQI